MKLSLLLFAFTISAFAAKCQWLSGKIKVDTVYIVRDTSSRLVLSYNEHIKYSRGSYRVSADSCYLITECDKTRVVTIHGLREIPFKSILYIK